MNEEAMSTRALSRLRSYNGVMGAFHLAQAVVVLALATDFTLPVVATFMSGPPGVGEPAVTHLFDASIAWGVAGFLLLSAAAHAVLVAPGVFGWYAGHLARGRNYARWIEYSLSSTLMVLLIALLTGIADVAALVGLGFANAGMILFGLLMEHYETPGRPRWLSYNFGVLVGAAPWLAIAIYLWSPGVEAQPPAFVYAIFFSLFAFFNAFAVNMVLQYRRVGPWRSYLFGESAYILLSLTAKSALAWQVFGATLAPVD
jgi:hypothetical protein